MHLWLFAVIIVCGVLLDQASKYWAVAHLMGQESRVLIPTLLDLTYVENTGAAFGIFEGRTTMLAAATVVILAVLMLYTLRKERKAPVFMLAVALISAGAVGNLIDRVWRGYVVDFLEFSFIRFPVFNLADCFVVVGVFLLGIQILFLEKGE